MIAIMSFSANNLFGGLASQKRRFDPGAYLFHRGDPVQSLFRVVEGEVQLVRHQEAGGMIVLQRAMPGDVVAEASVFAASYHCDAVPRLEAIVEIVPKDAFLTHFRQNPDFAETWAAKLARDLGKPVFLDLGGTDLVIEAATERETVKQAIREGTGEAHGPALAYD